MLMDDTTALPMDRDLGVERDESALIQAARTDADAFGELYRLYVGRVYRYLRSRTKREEDAADLTQQTFLQALNALPRYKERGLPFAAWLFRIARNVATDAHRRHRSTVTWEALPESLHPVEHQSPEAETLERDALAHLRALVAGLDLHLQELVTLHFISRLTLQEIALVVGTSETTVQRRLAKTLRSLKEQYLAE